ncbi:MAG: hypothetical protein B7Y12_22045 [Rhizobiales bacterium 24-66-13]|jgi:hypothetical protein|uniref:hypothetical protein n=1 Tax=Roseixanthobacter finlandensis TaxID=3119922 RepID=UPI000BC44238|nr:MAG: hypothetical protein B7Z41_03165 [Rhizobiales bacterium 12-66-7]OYY82767.1 MAG: hypothetical protein B7Y61_11210 [Rhizobiales bacterium 35-66-30]OYZ67190.1 MAG: hypothetical protein B7Y12_22045 [Rhizobiales bacterium 24-66-13]OZB09671.1 MAG: hypothetical protein B7X67_06765 [Rhizobiales bacterium 39-66-18]HQS08092.1 hypothetical protein [Xanthobacteraceae bacterium]
MRDQAPPDHPANERPAEAPKVPLDGETALVAAVDEGLALIAGTGELPASVQALLNGDPSTSTQAATVGWRRPDAPGDVRSGFVALVPLAALGRGRLSSILFRRPGQPARYALARRPLPLEAVLQAVAEDAGPSAAGVVDGIVEALLAGKPTTRRLLAVAAMAQAVARADGFVEVMGPGEDGVIFLQGWTADLVPGRARVIAIGADVALAELDSASFPREDLAGRSRGFAGLMAAPETCDVGRLQKILFRARDGWRAISVYERRVHLDPRDVPAHVRAVLPRLTAPTDVLAKVKAAGNRFDGRDTVSELKLPVRLGIDFALAMEGGGILVSGWLLDCEQHVRAVSLKVGREGVRIDENWTRQPRPDVTNAFLADPLFMALDAERHSHGFLAFVPRLAAGSRDLAHLELSLDDASAYRPLPLARAAPRQVLARLASAVEPRATAAEHLVERHLGPMVQQLERRAAAGRVVSEVGGFDDAAPLALVLGVNEGAEQAGVLLSLLALDPATRALPIVMAVPEHGFDAVAAQVRRLADFYRLHLRLVRAEGAEDVCDALEVGIRASAAEHIILLCSHILPRTAGWLPRLERAYRTRGSKCLVSPTLLFEDDSIRWAGTTLEGEGAARGLTDRLVGYPRAAAIGAEPVEVTAGTTECCILPRAAFIAVEGFSRGYLGIAEKRLDFALKLRLAGTPSVWVPEVEMVCADETIGGGGAAAQAWHSLVRRVDRWAFDRRWSLAVANMRS